MPNIAAAPQQSMPLDLLDLAKSHQRPMPTDGTPTRQANGTSPQPNSTRREMIEVTGPDGRAFQFCPETTQASIKKAMEREYGRPATHSLDEELIKLYNSQR